MNENKRVLRCLLILLFGFQIQLTAQHFRGLSVVNDNVAFVSGSKGTVLKTKNGGQHWDTISPRGYEKYDFRDIHVFSEKEIIVMASGRGGLVLKTKNGGKTWKEVFRDIDSNVFLDGMDFSGKMGKIVGDPIKKSRYNSLENIKGDPEFIILTSFNKGDLWEIDKFVSCEYCYPADNLFLPLENEALFAASGTSVLFTNYKLKIVTGGSYTTRFLDGIYYNKPLIVSEIPIANGPASGAYSMAIETNKYIIAVGGNYTRANNTDSCAAYSIDGGQTWLASTKQPAGYRSCVAIHPTKNLAVCTGTNGSDFSISSGKEWTKITLENMGFNVCMFSENYIWFAGNKGTWKRVKISDFWSE